MNFRAKRPFDCKHKYFDLKLGQIDLSMFFVFRSQSRQGKTKLHKLILNDSADLQAPPVEPSDPLPDLPSTKPG
jgi:hypothetical protein